ncbi:LOW QUALITY PROTEIN: hypothetical protein PanWU01x14_305580 [Parasponia andersonii]|uniref:Uncharacterized protein n=1 Tax=Parasponia andersonii TaxID=3476 RepID=A0A2P5AS69_PARAD|nr:LOW QUALITY PROTEIN: hypothetical protein PanWU01x14_305580 [Parasponia andersonii]
MSSEIKVFLRATAAEARFLSLEESLFFQTFASGKSHNFDCKSLSSSSTTTVGGALFVVLFTPNAVRVGRGGYTDIHTISQPFRNQCLIESQTTH